MADRPAVVADDLRKTFGGEVEALAGVSLQVQPGTVLGLLGPNGAGKTTTVNVLTTLLRPDSGHAEVDGVDVVADPGEARRRIGLAGQYAAVDEMLTGTENLELVGRLNHLPATEYRQRARELLDRFELSDAAGRRAKTYSGGMRRRLDLAAALVARPPVLFLDEPTTGLDPRSRLGLWEVIEQLVRDGTTLLLTTQYLEEADRLADRISVIDHGRVIADGTAEQLKAQLGTAVVEARLDDDAQAEQVRALLAESHHMDADRAGPVVRVPAPDGTRTLAGVVRALDAADVTARGLALREPSLDEVFLALTGHAPTDEAAPTDQAGDAGAERATDTPTEETR